jgi:hypothetical protein
MTKPLIVEICPNEPRTSMYLADGGEVLGSDYEADVLDCTRSGDVEPACDYVRRIGVDFRIIARNAAGQYENRTATAEEKTATARAIYFDSSADFDDEETAETYLIWQAASDLAA